MTAPAVITPTVETLVSRGARRLLGAGLERARAEAALLACHLLGVGKAVLLAHPERPVNPDGAARYDALIDRRARAEPLAYIVGEREFYGRPFRTDRRALIPRPETELLVEAALAEARSGPRPALIVDVGTGTGCIGATLALELPGARVIASDVSPEALDLSRTNLARFGLGRRIRLVRGDLLTWLRSSPAVATCLLVANLPYIPAETYDALPPDVRDYEPRLALDGGPGGTRLLLELLRQASPLPIRALLAELDPRHAEEVRTAARKHFPGRPVEVQVDLAGRPRLLRVGPGPGAG